MIVFENETDISINEEILAFLNEIKASICANEVELIIVDSESIRRLNREHLKKDYVTDVLSFGLDYSDIKINTPPLGSIVICIQKAIEVAESSKHSLRDEIAILFTHALLHLLGYDHEVDNGEHRAKESEILSHFGIDKGLISRV